MSMFNTMEGQGPNAYNIHGLSKSVKQPNTLHERQHVHSERRLLSQRLGSAFTVAQRRQSTGPVSGDPVHHNPFLVW